MDVEGHMTFGTQFEKELARQISACDIVLVVIGPKWLEIVQKRQNESNDYVRIEIEAALQQNKVVIPVFIQDAPIPRVEQLPESLRALPGLHAARLRADRFYDDCNGLIDHLLLIRRSVTGSTGSQTPLIPLVMLMFLTFVFGVSIYQFSQNPLSDIPMSTRDAAEVVEKTSDADFKSICNNGREEIDGICCWAGQENREGKCINKPRYCPPGKGIKGHSCEPVPKKCPGDKIVLTGTAICCYLGQKEGKGQCVGEPAKAKVNISTNRLDALIYIDNKRKGKGRTVKNIELKSNKKYTIMVRWKNEEIKRQLDVKPGGSYNLYLPFAQVSEPIAPVANSSSKKHKNMVYVPNKGSFHYGCNDEVDKQCYSDEKPGKKLTIKAFWIDKYEVSVEDYKTCVEAGKCSKPGTGGHCNWDKSNRGKHPINCVDWKQAKNYCRWLGKDLPTEVQWEKAARGTDGRKYPWGNVHYRDLGKKLVANIDSDEVEGYDDGYKYTSPVKSFSEGKSPYGALNMVGNVWEWTDSWYQKNTSRVVRGGSWGGATTTGSRGPLFATLGGHPAGSTALAFGASVNSSVFCFLIF